MAGDGKSHVARLGTEGVRQPEQERVKFSGIASCPPRQEAPVPRPGDRAVTAQRGRTHGHGGASAPFQNSRFLPYALGSPPHVWALFESGVSYLGVNQVDARVMWPSVETLFCAVFRHEIAGNLPRRDTA